MPSVLPRASCEPVAVFSHLPRCAAALRSGMPRKSATTSARTSSATLRVLENGALNTGMPRSSATARSTWRNAAFFGDRQIHLVGADAEAAHARQPGGMVEELAIQLRGRADADEIGVAGGALQVWGGQRFPVALNIGVTIRLQPLHGARMNAFQQEDLDFGLIERSLGHGMPARS